MKNIMLSVVVIAALVTAGLGGTFAHFSDTEESLGNYLQTGSLDLQVNGWDDPDVPPKIWGTCIAPCKSRDFTIEVENMGQCEYPAYLWMHIKNVDCGEVPQEKTGGMPEPEDVTQNGGRFAQVDLPGIGVMGEDCTLGDHISIRIWYDEDDDGVQDNGEVQVHKISDIVCYNKLLGRLDPCQLRYLYIDVHLQDVDEDELLTFGGVDNDGDGLTDEDGRGCVGDTPGVDDDDDGMIDEDPALDGNYPDDDVDGGYFDGGDADVRNKCYDKWPTNALMKDYISFDILFTLSQEDPEPPF
jgi:predicted ribosomally synthesized peptide with SipW-like signal peptide